MREGKESEKFLFLTCLSYKGKLKFVTIHLLHVPVILSAVLSVIHVLGIFPSTLSSFYIFLGPSVRKRKKEKEKNKGKQLSLANMCRGHSQS